MGASEGYSQRGDFQRLAASAREPLEGHQRFRYQLAEERKATAT